MPQVFTFIVKCMHSVPVSVHVCVLSNIWVQVLTPFSLSLMLISPKL
jgi:hypothetical protein